MALFLSNGASEIINVSLLTYDTTCTAGGQPCRKRGWYVIQPGQSVKPDALDLDLTTVNSWTYLYAYTASSDKSWQGTENAWFEVTGGVHFNQCGENEANCTKQVDFVGLNFKGPEFVAYIGPKANEVAGSPPIISVYVGVSPVLGTAFWVSGWGFIPGTSINIAWEYVFGGTLVENQTAATFTAGSDGRFSRAVPLSWLMYVGTLSVKATDSAWGLNATTTLDVTTI